MQGGTEILMAGASSIAQQHDIFVAFLTLHITIFRRIQVHSEQFFNATYAVTRKF